MIINRENTKRSKMCPSSHLWMLIVAAALSFLPGSFGVKYVDLTHPLNSKSVTWPPNPRFNLTVMHKGPWIYDIWLENNKFCTPEHVGTHMDAPAHFRKGKKHVDQVPLDRLIGPGCIIDIKKKVEMNIDYILTVDDFKDWEKIYGKIPEKAIVIMNSGWDKYQDDELKAWGTNNITDTTSYHFPGWSAEAINWLVKYRKINMIGVDTPSIDYGQSTRYKAHVAGAMNDLSMLENVANLDKIPPSGTIIYAAVTNILGGSGAPTRVFAVVDGNTSGTSRVQYTWLLLLCRVSGILRFL